MTELDPEPYFCAKCDDRYSYPSDSYPRNPHIAIFLPRLGFEQDGSKYARPDLYASGDVGNGPQPKPAPFLTPAIDEVLAGEGLSEAAINRTTDG